MTTVGICAPRSLGTAYRFHQRPFLENKLARVIGNIAAKVFLDVCMLVIIDADKAMPGTFGLNGEPIGQGP